MWSDCTPGITDADSSMNCRKTTAVSPCRRLPERMKPRVLEIHTAAVECIVLAACGKCCAGRSRKKSMKLMQHFCFDLGASWPSFIDLSKTLAEQILNSGKKRTSTTTTTVSCSLTTFTTRSCRLRRKPEKSAGADCRTPLYNHDNPSFSRRSRPGL